jgi:hypothetical protein
MCLILNTNQLLFLSPHGLGLRLVDLDGWKNMLANYYLYHISYQLIMAEQELVVLSLIM